MTESEKGSPEPRERYNALIKPTDDDWITVHDKFKDLLAQPTLRTEQILKSCFTAHERKLFMPATEPLSLRNCQEDNSRRYRSLISGRFKSCHLSMATKFAMLYFGLPVEPILSELVESAKPDFDVDDWDVLYDVEGLSLRGGGYDDEDFEMEDVRSLANSRFSVDAGQGRQCAVVPELNDDYEQDDVDGEPIMTGLGNPIRPIQPSRFDVGHPLASPIRQASASRSNVAGASLTAASRPTINVKFKEQPDEASQVHDCVPLYGYQGRIMFMPHDLSAFEAASRKLLSLRRHDGCDLVLVEFDRISKQVMKSFHDNIPINQYGAMANHLRKNVRSDVNCVWFVLRRGEAIPKEWEPQRTLFSSSLIKFSHVDDKGYENFSYCNVPSRNQYFDGPKFAISTRPPPKPWGANQYMPFVTTAQQVLTGAPDRPGASHCDIVISAEYLRTGTYSTCWYGGIEMHRGLLDAMHPCFAKGKPFVVETRSLPEESIVFYLPRGVAKSVTALENRQCHRQTTSEDPYPDALKKLQAMTMDLEMPKDVSYRILRGIDYFNPLTKDPSRDYKPDSEAQKQDQYQEKLSKFIVNAVDNKREPCRFFVIQPFYGRNDLCTIETPRENNGSAEYQADSDTMETLKAKVERLYRDDPKVQYDPQQDSMLIEPIFKYGGSGQWNPVHFILRSDAADYELVMVRRLSVAQTMRITVLKNDELDFGIYNMHRSLPVENRYFATQKQPGEVSQETPRPPEQHPRESSWETQPSVYDNGIYHPSFPINAPPVESVMRTGGSRVPMITKNALTVTEQHEIQGALWNARGMVLDRILECPYEGCNFTYRVDEDKKLVRHLEEKHNGQKCPWCDNRLFSFWSRKQKEAHYKSAHADELQRMLEQPQTPVPRPPTSQTSVTERPRDAIGSLASPLSSFKIMERARLPAGPLPRPVPPPRASEKEADYRYCDRCGRDHTELRGRAEREHHDRVCVPLAEGGGLCTFCEVCGDCEWKTERDAKEFAPFDEYPHKCRGNVHRNKPHCTKCGLSMNEMTDEVIDKHRKYCAGYYGTMGCFCPYCQHHFVKDKTQHHIEDIKKHISGCSEREPRKTTPYEIYPEAYWKDQDVPADPLYLGRSASATLVRKQRRPNGPTRYLSFPLMWYEKSGPMPTHDPPSECKLPGCREPLFGLTPSEVLGHFETNHGGQPQKKCPLCHLSFKRSRDELEGKPELEEWEDRKDQVAHMECHVYQLWDILAARGPPPHTTNREPFYAGHSLWDPDNERALDRRDKRCPHFDKCGAMVGFMNQKQWNRHMETAHAAEDFELRVTHDRTTDIQTVFDDRRLQRIREGKPPMAGQVRPVPQPKGPEKRAKRDSGRKLMATGPAVQSQGQLGASKTQAGGEMPAIIHPQTVVPKQTRPEENVPRGNRPEGARPHKKPETQATDHPRHEGGTAAKPRNHAKKSGKSTAKTNKPPRPTGKQTGKTPSKSALGTKPMAAAPAQSFDADDDMYCSRCFRKAPKRGSKAHIPEGDPTRQEQIDAHSDPKRSCRIRPQEGRVRFNHDEEPILPSRVGWIRKDNLNFKDIRDAFARDNPNLERTMCPTDSNWKRTYSKWVHDPNNENNQDVWGLPYRPKKDQKEEDSEEDDGEEDYVEGDEEEGDEEEGDEDEYEEMSEEEEEEEEEEGEEDKEEEGAGQGEEQEEQGGLDGGGDGAKDNPENRHKRKHKMFRGIQPHDPTYRDRGDDDSLSEEDPRELVPESRSDGDGNAESGGGKRKRHATASRGERQASKKGKTQERERKKARVSEGGQSNRL
ncbi:uncharacterized protein ColSpa_01552 [Colletotrichum spaethianum]|uniref:C2H2-type domain-containing protein n=1 Tax=Colletotrichum spaethianum TaxID=700344 RepID=A0AA37L423_9PEZI|nr:uncharacterized protein ColSpa_01552 [Colletotrichum spaethianum]GKT41371.1 hypothetical protein ColSpa_01552 [Colletotrichum spaethianum]